MAPPVLLQLLDNFLFNYNVGDALFAGFVLSILAVLPKKSMKIMAANLMLFGLLFLLTPSSTMSLNFKLLGVPLLVAGPVLFFYAKQ